MTGLKEAMFYIKKGDGSTCCFLCPHNCVISPGHRGVCGVRQNIDGCLYSLIFERVASISLDRIEKKPLRKFHPGSYILSLGSVGCNLQCPFCQNHSIARTKCGQVQTISIKSHDVVEKALKLTAQGNIGIAYTYNEPSIWYEYVYETAQLAQTAGLVNVMVTNGFINQEPLRQILRSIDAMNIDLKAYNNRFYADIVKGNLEDVKNTIKIAASHCHVEITTLVIPGLNDSVGEISEMSKWLASISPEIPLHLSRFFPNYQMTDNTATPLDTLAKLENTAKKYLKNVYIGNV
ncbi:MAG: AmmeMemoRadiSam system radical SAM enzyme [Bacillota bacterium]|jgi:pyruvate formate lyase activating enzyme